LGSVNHPKLYDPAAMNLVKGTFHEVWSIIEGQNALVIADDTNVLKAAIIEKLLGLVSDGVLDKEMLKAEVLRQVPLA
jgi:hypothetical protein